MNSNSSDIAEGHSQGGLLLVSLWRWEMKIALYSAQGKTTTALDVNVN